MYDAKAMGPAFDIIADMKEGYQYEAEEKLNAIGKAFEAMQEALQAAPTPAGKGWLRTYPDWFHLRCAALGLAEKVSK